MGIFCAQSCPFRSLAIAVGMRLRAMRVWASWKEGLQAKRDVAPRQEQSVNALMNEDDRDMAHLGYWNFSALSR